MSLVPMTALVKAAKDEGYAVGQFNFSTLEFAQAAWEAAEAERAPLILGVTGGGLRHMGIPFAAAIGRTIAKQASVPVVLHLDHGSSFELVMQCLRAGFSSVMFDGSRLTLEENIRQTGQIVKVAHSMGVSVEAEVGAIGGVEDDHVVDVSDALVAAPADAIRLYNETGIDAIAVAVGNAHGMYKSIPNIRIDIVTAVAEAIPIPVVLHGGSGTPDAIVKKAIAAGCGKINVSTEFQVAFTDTLRTVLQQQPDLHDSRKCLGPAREAIKKVVVEKMRLFGVNGRA